MILDDLNKCDKHGDMVYFQMDECPQCSADKIAGLVNLIKSMDAYLDSGPAPKKNTICHGSIFHKQMKEILND